MLCVGGALLWSLVVLSGVVSADLVPPYNLSLVTINTQYTLTWAWAQSPGRNAADAPGLPGVTFTVQYLSKYKLRRRDALWTTVCDSTPHTHCDFTSANMHYLAIYVLRVCASRGGQNSTWVQRDFCPDREASLGPPAQVQVIPAGELLDVFISPPLTSTNESMKSLIPKLSYRIMYWEQATPPQDVRPQTLDTEVLVVTLPDLLAWTVYCVRVQSRYDYYEKASRFTAQQCMQTQGATQWWKVVLFFLASLVICFLLVMMMYAAYRCYWVLKATMYPAVPAHIQEYFCDSSPGSDLPRLLATDTEVEICDRLSICPEPVQLETHTPTPFKVHTAPPVALEADSSGRHSRQGSGDSGMYSTEEGSRQTQPSSGQTQPDPGLSSGGTGPRQCPLLAPEQLKMLDLVGHAAEDEGVGDMCV